VSNFSVRQIDRVAQATGVTPAANQIEWRPSLYDAGLVAAHAERGVVLEGYSALRGGSLNDPVVRRVAEEAGRTPAQVLVRWHVQHGIVVIPRSSKPERVRENADVGDFALTDDQMAALDGLGRP
jgi:diketogulonate reductase-like aldo/keto reductase